MSIQGSSVENECDRHFTFSMMHSTGENLLICYALNKKHYHNVSLYHTQYPKWFQISFMRHKKTFSFNIKLKGFNIMKQVQKNDEEIFP